VSERSSPSDPSWTRRQALGRLLWGLAGATLPLAAAGASRAQASGGGRSGPARPGAAVVRVPAGGSIQRAVDAAPPGGEVRIAPGEYVETVIIDKPLTLASETGYADTVIRADHSRFRWRGVRRDDQIVGAVNVMKTRDVRILGLALEDAIEGVWVSASQRVLVAGCMSCDHVSSGYYFWASREATLLRSDGRLNAVGVYQGNSVDITIAGNRFTANHGGRVPHLDNEEFPGIGILVGNASTRCSIGGNHSFANADWGLGIGEGVSHVVASGNDLRGQKRGASVNGPHLALHRNNLVGNSEAGLVGDEHTDARYNWWGDPSGPSGDAHGSGAAVRGAASYRPWLSRPVGVPPFAF